MLALPATFVGKLSNITTYTFLPSFACDPQSSGYKLAFQSLSVDTALQSKTINYLYDGLSRLQSAVYADGTRSWLYDYDLSGNRTREEATIGITTSIAQWTYDEANRIATMQLGSNPVVNFQYDDNGNLLDDGQLTYTWDRANRLKTVNNGSYNTHYAYDGEGHRFQQTLGGAVTDYLLDLQPSLALVLRETSFSDSFAYLHGPRGLQAAQNDGDWFTNLQDGLGSSRMQVAEDFQIQASQVYSPYGLPFDTNGSFLGSFGYANEQVDANGLSYNRARYYNLGLGNFTALDPYEGTLDEPLSLNGYAYVHGNPINLTDACGKSPLDFLCLISPIFCSYKLGYELSEYVSSNASSMFDPSKLLANLFCGMSSFTDGTVTAPPIGGSGVDWGQGAGWLIDILKGLTGSLSGPSLISWLIGKGEWGQRVLTGRELGGEKGKPKKCNCEPEMETEPPLSSLDHFNPPTRETLLCYLTCYGGASYVALYWSAHARANAISTLPGEKLPILFRPTYASVGAFIPADKTIVLRPPEKINQGVGMTIRTRGDVLATLVEEIIHANQFYSLPGVLPCKDDNGNYLKTLDAEKEAKTHQLLWIDAALSHPEVDRLSFRNTLSMSLSNKLEVYQRSIEAGNTPEYPFKAVGCPPKP